jgi:hypothetical protein
MQIEKEESQEPMQIEEEKNGDQLPAQNVEQMPEGQAQQQNLSESDIRINNILETFNVTREQVKNSGIDIEVLSFLPEFELVSILSEIASANPPPDNEPSNNPPAENHPVENQQPAENQQMENQPPQNQEVNAEPSPQVPSHPDQPSQLSQLSPMVSPRAEPEQPSTPLQPQARSNDDQDMLNQFFTMLNQPQPASANQNAAQPQNNQNMGNDDLMHQFQQAINMNMNIGMNINQPLPPMFQHPFMPQNPPQQNINFPPQIPPAPPIPSVSQQPSQQPVQPSNPALPEGIDEEFFNSLPEDCKQELLRDSEMLRRNLGQPPSEPADISHAEQMDTASFLATIADESLRREIMLGLDDNTLNALPPRLQQEARRYQRELHRRQFRRDREEENARYYRRAMEDHLRGRERDRNRQREEKLDTFMDIIKRREERYKKLTNESVDVSGHTITSVFTNSSNLKNLAKIVFIETMRKNDMAFERLIEPFLNL